MSSSRPEVERHALYGSHGQVRNSCSLTDQLSPSATAGKPLQTSVDEVECGYVVGFDEALDLGLAQLPTTG